jgi:hypothetical protein
MWSRRSFLAAIGLAGAAAVPVLGERRIGLAGGPEARRDPAEPIRGERYAGFVLLPEGAPVPYDVQAPRRESPILCGVGEGRGGPSVTAIHSKVRSEADLASEVGFPVYLVAAAPAGLTPAGGDVLRYEDGEVFAASLDFQTRNALNGEMETTVSLWAYPEFPRPYPLWETSPPEPGGPFVQLHKVDFLPTPGVMMRSAQGYVFLWIQADVLYTLTAENNPSWKQARSLAESLVELPGRGPRRPLEN